jgi:hypothetical protein
VPARTAPPPIRTPQRPGQSAAAEKRPGPSPASAHPTGPAPPFDYVEEPAQTDGPAAAGKHASREGTDGAGHGR